MGALVSESRQDEFLPEFVRPSSLREILEPEVDPRFDLSAKACEGILRRAERRGRKLPPALESALRGVVEGTGRIESYVPEEIAGTVQAHHARNAPDDALVVRESHAREVDCARCVDSQGSFASGQGGTVVCHETGVGWWKQDDAAGTLRAEGEDRPSRPSHVVRSSSKVRRLTPRECERLQGLPDDWTRIPWKVRKTPSGAEETPDSPRYRAVGNSVAVPVLEAIGRRLAAWEGMFR